MSTITNLSSSLTFRTGPKRHRFYFAPLLTAPARPVLCSPDRKLCCRFSNWNVVATVSSTGSVHGCGDECAGSTAGGDECAGSVAGSSTGLDRVHVVVNDMSKWFVVAAVGAFILMRNIWTTLGFILNVELSLVLKQILNRQRPVSSSVTGPGMPSSHAQGLFFVVVFMILSMMETHGLNGITAFLSVLVLAFVTYLSWLRVLLHYHEASQVFAGTLLGCTFSFCWHWTWNSFVRKAFVSNPWVRISVLGATCLGLGRILYLVWFGIIMDKG